MVCLSMTCRNSLVMQALLLLEFIWKYPQDIDFNHGYIHIEVAKGGRPRTVVAPKPTLDTYVFSCPRIGR